MVNELKCLTIFPSMLVSQKLLIINSKIAEATSSAVPIRLTGKVAACTFKVCS